jgi:hypothetical protein
MRGGSQKFLRAAAYHATNEVCNLHLKQWRFVYLLAEYHNHLTPDGFPFTELTPYLKDGDPWAIGCPLNGYYLFPLDTLGPITCSTHNIIEEP